MACGKLFIDDKEIKELYIDDQRIDHLYIDDKCVFRRAAPSGSIVFDVTGDFQFTIPYGHDKVSICMVGGGGTGKIAPIASDDVGGGYAGTVITQEVAVQESGTYQIRVGSGGSGDAAKGGDSKFHDITATGGKGGLVGGGYRGQGGSRTTCGGTGHDGSRTDALWGGQSSGFGNGGNVGDANPAGVGSGSGASSATGTPGNGGRGEVRVAWGTAQEREQELRRLAEDPVYRSSKSFTKQNGGE